MPEPRNEPDAVLKARAVELHRLTVMAEAANRRTQPKSNKPIIGNWAIAITEVIRAVETLHIVTASDPRAYDWLRANPRWLRPHERVMGAHINYYEAVEGKRSKTNRIHAEQLAPWIIIHEVNGTIVRVVANIRICEACIRWYEEFLPHVRLIDPDPEVQLRRRAAQPPPVPAAGPVRGRVLGPSQPAGSAYTVGQRAAAGAVLLVQAANYAIGEYVSRREEARYQEALRAHEGFLREFQEKHPTVGVLVIAVYEDAVFRRLEFSYGMTEIQARRTIPASMRSGTERSFVAQWRPPRQQPDVMSLPPPLTPVMLATFYRRQVFQNLEFRVADGFDDEGETDLGYPQRGKEARFWILRPPARVDFYFGSDRGTKEIDIFRWPLVSGEVVECVDLDPTMFSSGSDCAFPAYPADVATDVTFTRVHGISDNIHALRAYDFDRVRWIAPHRARSIGG